MENPIKGTRSVAAPRGLKTNEDGSLRGMCRRNPPAGTRKQLAASPDGPFWTVLRNYGPADSIINGSYKRPDYAAQPLK